MTFGVLAAVAASSPSSNDVTPGLLGFVVFAVMAVALVFLLKSMNKQFRKIAPKAEGPTGSQGAAESEPGQNQASAQEAPK